MGMALLFFILAFICLVLWIFGAIKPTKVFLGANSTRKKVTQVYGFGLVASLFAFTFFAVSNSPAPGPTYPEGATQEQKATILRLWNIQKIDKDFVSTEEEWDDQRLVVKYQPKAVLTESSWMRQSFSAAKSTMQTLSKTAPDHAYKQVVFDVWMPTTDKLGKDGFSRGMILQWNWDEIKGANWDNLSAAAVGGLAEKASFQRLGRHAAIEYCGDEDNLRFARDFCLKLLE
ncbi:hypothetical protein [Castellaniella sp.]|uniref:hypothetical protein n=1 Tax=Castellaniella sp. TaxID=1955812 RepID=UPI002AFE34E8|nr:hypothetical protein [Castellaniella sp.]